MSDPSSKPEGSVLPGGRRLRSAACEQGPQQEGPTSRRGAGVGLSCILAGLDWLGYGTAFRAPGPHVCGCWVIDLLLGKR
jgi:hypothetical protein